MEKVKLPKKVAEELESIKIHESYPVRLVVDIFSGAYAESGALKEYFESDRSRRIGYIMTALVNGYEVEETPEDSLRELFTSIKDDLVNPKDYYKNEVIAETIIRVLGILNIKIEGVNT